MPSYLSYKAKMAVLDAKDDDVKAWITVNGNHIPIMKGQSKEDAVKSFIASKSDKASAKRESKPTSAGEATKKVVEQTKKNQEIYKEHKKQETAKKTDKKLAERSNKPEHIGEATKRVEKTIKGENKTKDVSGKKYVKSLSDDYWEDFDVGNTSYVAQKRDDGLLQITSVHPHDSTEYHSAYTDGENAMIIRNQQKVGEVKFKSKEQLAKELKKYDEKAKLGARILHN